MIIEIYKHIEPRRFLDCRIKTLQEMLRSLDISVTPEDTMVLSESLAFYYGDISFSSAGIYNLPYCVSSEMDIDTTLFKNIGIKWVEENIGSRPEEWKHMKHLIDNGIPILFKMDARFLNYKATEKEQLINIHYLSSLLLVGYKDDMSAVYVVLCNDDSTSEPKEIPFDDFVKYRNTKCHPFSPNNKCIYILPSENQRIMFSSKERLLQSYGEICCKFEGREPTSISIAGFECSEMYQGFYAIEQLRKHIVNLQRQVKTHKTEAHKKYICVSLLFLKKNMMFGTYSAFRYEFSQCLKKHAKTLDAPLLLNAAMAFESSANMWKHIFIYVSKAVHDVDHIAHYLRKISACLKKILRYEKQALLAIKQGVMING